LPAPADALEPNGKSAPQTVQPPQKGENQGGSYAPAERKGALLHTVLLGRCRWQGKSAAARAAPIHRPALMVGAR
ncbi:hypothetical protein DC030_14725, partial [Enterococcus faecalis]